MQHTDVLDDDAHRAAPLRILHVSCDYPDAFNAAKTKAVKSLIELTRDEFDHFVVSLNRASVPAAKAPGFAVQVFLRRPLPLVEKNAEKHGLAVRYQAPGKGLLHKTCLVRLAEQLAENLITHETPELLFGHKLGIEGIVVHRLAQLMSRPFGLCLQGDTDTKILQYRPDLSKAFAQIYHEAEVVFPFAPWTRAQVEAKLGRRSKPTIILPCATHIDAPIQPVTAGEGLVSVFHLASYRRKNLSGLVAASVELERRGRGVPLSIIGGGSPNDRAACEAITARSEHVTLTGPADRQQVRSMMSSAAGFVLPSLRESFGMVFIEALLSGLPIVYPRDRAVAGYFDGLPFAIPVDPQDPRALADAMARLVDQQEELKGALAEWIDAGNAERFSDARIARDFTQGLQAAAFG